MAVNGDPDAQTGIGVHLYLANTSMQRRAFVNADGEFLIVPQQGALRITTELGLLDVAPGEIALIPRGLAFKVEVRGPSRGYVCENYGAAFRLPELGPIGSNGWPIRATSSPRSRPSRRRRKALTRSSRNSAAGSGRPGRRTRPSTSSPGTAIWRPTSTTRRTS